LTEASDEDQGPHRAVEPMMMMMMMDHWNESENMNLAVLTLTFTPLKLGVKTYFFHETSRISLLLLPFRLRLT
jgi:hypothetical protein